MHQKGFSNKEKGWVHQKIASTISYRIKLRSLYSGDYEHYVTKSIQNQVRGSFVKIVLITKCIIIGVRPIALYNNNGLRILIDTLNKKKYMSSCAYRIPDNYLTKGKF